MNLKTIKSTFATGLAIAIPLGVVLYVFVRLFDILEKLIGPLATKLGIDRILGGLTLTIFSVLMFLLAMFVLGLLMRISFLAGLGKSIEDLVFRLIPSLNAARNMMAEKLDVQNALGTWKPVMMHYEEIYMPAFLIEESDDLVTLFLMKGIELSEGEILITKKEKVRLTELTTSQIHIFSKQFGKGYLSVIKSSQ